MRLADSVNTAFYESEGECWVEIISPVRQLRQFNNRFELDGIEFPEPTPQLFNYNNPYGACPTCEGYGRILGIDPDKVVPDKTKSVYDGAIAPWKGEKYGEWLISFCSTPTGSSFRCVSPFEQLSKAEQKLLWTGNEWFSGINAFFQELESKTYKIQNRVTLGPLPGPHGVPHLRRRPLAQRSPLRAYRREKYLQPHRCSPGRSAGFFQHHRLDRGTSGRSPNACCWKFTAACALWSNSAWATSRSTAFPIP
jgi:excinuclease UvrABC ATPase subunit